MLNKRWIQREKVKAVHDYDLEQFLFSIGALEKIKNGFYHCLFCNAVVTINNLGALYPKNDKINFVCDRPSCIAEIELPSEGSNG
ncbi:MAG: hypothetical protein L0Y74_00020 [candidate division Zixibacteria bacterium]|nr:hypothetical protein [candidate division Zixibacteria bacterium]